MALELRPGAPRLLRARRAQGGGLWISGASVGGGGYSVVLSLGSKFGFRRVLRGAFTQVRQVTPSASHLTLRRSRGQNLPERNVPPPGCGRDAHLRPSRTQARARPSSRRRGSGVPPRTPPRGRTSRTWIGPPYHRRSSPRSHGLETSSMVQARSASPLSRSQCSIRESSNSPPGPGGRRASRLSRPVVAQQGARSAPVPNAAVLAGGCSCPARSRHRGRLEARRKPRSRRSPRPGRREEGRCTTSPQVGPPAGGGRAECS